MLYIDFSSSITELMRGSGFLMLIIWLIIVVLSVMMALDSGAGAMKIVGMCLVAVVIFVAVIWLLIQLSRRDTFIENRALAQVTQATNTLRQIKTDQIVPIVSQFFASGRQSVVQGDMTKFRVFWQPSVRDYQATFVNGAPPSRWTIEDVACIDRDSRVPLDALDSAPTSAIMSDPPNPRDCNLSIDDGMYAFERSALVLDCWTSAAGAKNQIWLHAKRDSIATKALMLMRPSLLRVGGIGFRLYVVDYGSRDGLDYDSGAAGEFAMLRLRAADAWDHLSGASSLPPTERGQHQVISYYVAYKERRPIYAGKTDIELHAATVLVAGGSGSSTMYRRTGAAAHQRLPLLSLNVTQRSGAPNAATVALQNGARRYAFVGGSTATIVTWSRDVVVMCALSPDRVRVKRIHHNVPMCAYNLSGSGEDGMADAHPKLQFPRTAIPCLVDVWGRMDPSVILASRSERTSEMARNATGLARALFATPDSPPPDSNTLLAFPDNVLLPGKYLISSNRQHTLTLDLNGQLTLRRGRTVRWSSKTPNMARPGPGKLTLDKGTGVLTLKDSRGGDYWYSAVRQLSDHLSPPFRLVLTDEGEIEVRGADARVYWARGSSDESGQQSGYPWFDTCAMASRAYGLANREIIAKSPAPNVTPWVHWRYRGGRDVLHLHWPGVQCE